MRRWENLLTERFAAFDRENSHLGIQFPFISRHLTGEALPRAAVSLIIKIFNEELFVLLTKRSLSLRNYGGDVCLPGGRYEPSDLSLVNTALRETQEEVGISPHNLFYICTLPTLPVGIDNVTAVTTVVFLAKSELVINVNTSEVEMAFWVPLDVFFNENTTTMPKSFVHKGGKKFSTVAFEYYDSENQMTFIIWGFTARICVTAASVALNRSPYFPFTVLTLVSSPSDDGTIALAEVFLRTSFDAYCNYSNKHVYVQSKL